jgi:hypothetical protein
MGMRRTRADAGIAIGPILFIIAILGLLASAIAAGSGAFTASTSTAGAKANAQTIISYANEMAFAVEYLIQGNGCDETQINFQNSIFRSSSSAPYTNATAPGDGSCDVFNPNGGRMEVRQMPVDAFTSCCTGNVSSYEYRYPRLTGTRGTAGNSTNADLWMMIGDIKRDVCLELNNLMGVTNPSGEPKGVSGTCYTTGSPFLGTYTDSGVTWCGVSEKPSACVYDAYNGGHYYFYKTLLVR